MKKKLIFSLVLCLFAGLTVLNISFAHSSGSSDTSLDHISVMAKAFDGVEKERTNNEGEGGGGPFWKPRVTKVSCSITHTTKVYIGPATYTITETLYGKQQVCDDGWGWCITKCNVKYPE